MIKTIRKKNQQENTIRSDSGFRKRGELWKMGEKGHFKGKGVNKDTENIFGL